jgi:hypothetical protein
MSRLQKRRGSHARGRSLRSLRPHSGAIVLVVLNRWSLGGLSRRWGPQARRPLLGQAQDYSVGALRALVRQALGERLRGIHYTSTLFPNGLWQFRAPVPLGEVLGMAVVLATLSNCPAGQ